MARLAMMRDECSIIQGRGDFERIMAILQEAQLFKPSAPIEIILAVPDEMVDDMRKRFPATNVIPSSSLYVDGN